MEQEDQILIKDLEEGDLFISKSGNEGEYLKKLDDGKYLLKNLKDNSEYEAPHGNFLVFKKIIKNKLINIKCDNVFKNIKKYSDSFFNTIYSDPPYQLGNKFYIDDKDGRFKVKGKSKDFMNKWDGLNEDDLDLFFKESFRILKYGGFCIMYSIDRCLPFIQYYAIKNGFEIHQSLYWYFINSMPKSVDAGKILKKKGEQELSDRFSSHKYSIAPFKQCVETIMIFHKPCKNGSVLNDLLSYEKDSEISPSVVNIDENRIPINPEIDDPRLGGKGSWKTDKAAKNVYEGGYAGKEIKSHESGRYPSQVFIDSNTEEILDNQSGTLKSGYMSPDKHKRNKTDGKYQSDRGIYGKYNNTYLLETYGDSGGCSRILHKCDYEEYEYDLFNYCKKPTKKERNLGLTEDGTGSNTYNKKCLKCGKWQRDQQGNKIYTCVCEEPEYEKPTGNLHPCVKPISLNYKILNLFKLPEQCDQKIYIPFCGSGSEIIGALKSGYKEENIYCCEINQEYVDISNKRIEYWKEQFKNEKEKKNKENVGKFRNNK